MKTILLGANGQLGTDLQQAVNDRETAVSLVPLFRSDLDVSNVDAIADELASRDFDALINCTSYHKTDEVETNATQGFTINAHAVQALANVCRDKNAKFVHISTDYVFDGTAASPLTEADAPGPINVYGASKFMGERLASLAHPDGTYILRVASLFGIAGASGKGGNFVETMIKVGRDRGELKVVDDVTMSPTATADIALMILALLEKNAPAGIYHGVNSGQATWYEFASQIISRAGVDATVAPCTSDEFPTKALRPAYSVLDNSKLTSVMGTIPTWQDALDRYLAAKGHTG